MNFKSSHDFDKFFLKLSNFQMNKAKNLCDISFERIFNGLFKGHDIFYFVYMKKFKKLTKSINAVE